MAIAFGAYAEGGNTDASSLTFTSPTVSGNNTLGVVGVFVQTNLSITGVTWAGVAMTFIGRVTNSFVNERIELWYISAPTDGANNVIISRTGSSNGLNGYAAYYTGTAQSGQPDASTTDMSTTASFTVSLTTISDNSWAVLFARNDSGAFTAGTGTTFRSSAGSVIFGDSNAPLTPAGSKSMNVTTAGAYECLGVMASFYPPLSIYNPVSKNATSYSTVSKNATSYSTVSKNSTSYTGVNKS